MMRRERPRPTDNFQDSAFLVHLKLLSVLWPADGMGLDQRVSSQREPRFLGHGVVGRLPQCAHTQSASTASPTASDGEVRGMQGTATRCESVSC
jgi:hypothetical protein